MPAPKVELAAPCEPDPLLEEVKYFMEKIYTDKVIVIGIQTRICTNERVQELKTSSFPCYSIRHL